MTVVLGTPLCDRLIEIAREIGLVIGLVVGGVKLGLCAVSEGNREGRRIEDFAVFAY